MMRASGYGVWIGCGMVACFLLSAEVEGGQGYRLLATKKTSTMNKEMNQAAADGYRFDAVMGGETSFGGSETVVVMRADDGDPSPGRFEYLLLATNKTSTMQKELTEAGGRGFAYRGQTVFNSAFGGQEVVVILEKDSKGSARGWQYKLLATKKTSTMNKELNEAAGDGFDLVGLTVSKTAFGGEELVSILQKRAE